MFSDTIASIKKPGLWLFTTWFKFLVRYRRTALGPIWIIAAPTLFILFLGSLFVGLSGLASSIFIPHLTIGLVAWTLLGGYLSRSHDLFKRNQAYLFQGKCRPTDIVLIDNAELVIHFLHQCILIVVVCVFYGTVKSTYAFVSLIGLLMIIMNGFWLSIMFGILGSRFRDLSEIIISIVSIAFLATPIIWMSGPESAAGGRGAVLNAYQTYNPFYHFLELFRAPLLGKPIDSLSWYVVAAITVIGYLFTAILYRKYRHLIPVWTQ